MLFSGLRLWLEVAWHRHKIGYIFGRNDWWVAMVYAVYAMNNFILMKIGFSIVADENKCQCVNNNWKKLCRSHWHSIEIIEFDKNSFSTLVLIDNLTIIHKIWHFYTADNQESIHFLCVHLYSCVLLKIKYQLKTPSAVSSKLYITLHRDHDNRIGVLWTKNV